MRRSPPLESKGTPILMGPKNAPLDWAAFDKRCADRLHYLLPHIHPWALFAYMRTIRKPTSGELQKLGFEHAGMAFISGSTGVTQHINVEPTAFSEEPIFKGADKLPEGLVMAGPAVVTYRATAEVFDG